VYVAVKNGKHLLAQAPTGLGKTLGVLFPVLRAMGEGRVDKALYLTARNTGAAAAMDALNRLRAGGARVRSLALTARDQVCLAPDRACTGEDCPFAAGYYDRREAAAAELLAEEALDRRVVEAVARRRSVCPFELSRDAAPWVDVIIGDYNYVFDPQVGLKRVLEREEKRCFLVDEAHNLPDRAREMYSASVRGASVVEAVESRGKTCSKTAAAGRRVLDWLESAAPERPGDGYFVEPEPPEEWLALLSSAARTVEQAWAEGREVDEGVRGFYYQAVDFLRVAEGFDPSSAFYYAREADGPTARLFCLDPAPRLTQAWKKAASVVVFSATLSPRYYYQTELGLAEDAAGLALASPFPPDNRFLVVADRVDTRYRFRERSKGRLAETIAAALSGKSGNFLLFFPSYQYLALTAPALDQYLPEADILAQAPDMGAADREAFLARLTAAGAGLRVGMAVLGGVFAEGVDLAGGRLAGAVVVGVGLPGVGPERELLRDYYDRVRGDGFRCAYLYPGMRRVIQAAGRIIRAEDERGVIVLIDRRFTLPDYRACFPPDWRPMTAGEPRRLAAMVRGFAAS
jgi:DNA excision repair protein ERCC-2